MMIKYNVQISDWTADGCTTRTIRNLNLTKAWRIVERNARRGLRLYGGRIQRGNWGADGGQFPSACRSAYISQARTCR